MARRLVFSEEDVSCSICCDVFKNPVVLKCSHSFCKSCLQECWGTQGRNRDCPLCRSHSVDDPVPSLILKNLCDSVNSHGEELEEKEELVEDGVSDCEMCPVHSERLKLFCLVDQEPICLVCHTSKKHKMHKVCPVSEAIADMKDKMKSTLKSLKTELTDFDKVKKNYENCLAHIKVQSQSVEKQTREEFEKLHSFLRAEEEDRMKMLKEEEEEKSRAMIQKIAEMDKTLASMSAHISTLEAAIEKEDISILQNCKNTLTSLNSKVPVLKPGALIDVAKYVGTLAFNVWMKMRNVIKYSPVILNPNTACRWLNLSDDLTSFTDSDQKHNLPDIPERFDPDTAVFGHKGISTGTHTWDVDLGDNTAWTVGVALTSVPKKENVASVLTNGFLCLHFQKKLFAGTTPLTQLPHNPKRIRVKVDCNKDQVSFYDAQNSVHIFTFKQAITKVYPYFRLRCNKSPITIEPQEFFVTGV